MKIKNVYMLEVCLLCMIKIDYISPKQAKVEKNKNVYMRMCMSENSKPKPMGQFG